MCYTTYYIVTTTDIKVKRVFVTPPVNLTDRHLAWIADNLIDVDNLYIYFDLSEAEWTVIKKNNPDDYASKKRALLFAWRKKKGTEATLANLVSALAEPENIDTTLIERIIQHCGAKCKS